MKFTTRSPVLPRLKTDLLGLGVEDGKIVSPLGREIDRRLNGLIARLIKREGFQGKAGETRLVETHGKIGAETILLMGMGKDKNRDLDFLRKASSWLVRAGNKIRAKKISLEEVPFPDKKMPPEKRGQAIAEGALLGNYSFDLYKSQNNHGKKTVTEFEILLSNAANRVDQGVKKGIAFAEATTLARDLVNIPASDMTPKRMAEEARKIARASHLKVKIYDRRQTEKMGMGCYLAVAKGSSNPPYFIHLTYRPSTRPKKRIAFIGKAITFDSGGLSLKTAQSMETMKDDMSGAAAMLGVMKALSVLKPRVEVHGIAAVAENMPSGSSDKPGDIARAINGKTVEILNTDAEGRLTLADAIPYALKQKPDILIDAATLTGACVIALGELCSGIMGNNQELVDRLIACGREAGEKIWQLPLIEEYKEEIKSPVADLKNTGGRWGGTITAGLFLQEFTDPKVPWAHIDIAGPSWTEKELDYCSKGGTGHIVRTILEFLLET